MTDKGVCIGVSSFLSSVHPFGSCGDDGLPLIACSVRIYGRFKELCRLKHQNLCKYVDLVRASQGRIIVVHEYYNNSLSNINPEDVKERLSEIVFGTLRGLECLAENGITHRNLSPSNILLTDDINVKLVNYGTYFMTEENNNVPFPIGHPLYICPENLLFKHGLEKHLSHPIGDVWSLGMVVFDWLTRFAIISDKRKDAGSMVRFVIEMVRSKESPLEFLIAHLPDREVVKWWPENLKDLLNCCLQVYPRSRKAICDLLNHPFVSQLNSLKQEPFLRFQTAFWDLDVDSCCSRSLPLSTSKNSTELDHSLVLLEHTVEELYYFAQLLGCDVANRSKHHDSVHPLPVICTLPKVITGAGDSIGTLRDRTSLYDESIYILSLADVEQKLASVHVSVHYPLVMAGEAQPPEIREVSKLPIQIRNRSFEYQLYRINIFRSLLLSYPTSSARIAEEARIDIPPLYRGRIWAALLQVKGNYREQYYMVDKLSPSTSDKQIDVDVPRCHQYDQLMSCPSTREKLRRILKAWIKLNTHLVYWQGLDSLVAPFLTLNINDEALAFACMKKFVDKFCHNFFLKDNSSVITEYLTVFSQLLAFHDPELATHLVHISFKAELYAIPWFLTMFSHVFPLHTVYQLWDTLLLGSPTFPMCVGIAILMMARIRLLKSDFNECILLFADLPGVKVDECILSATHIYNCTPPSLSVMVNENQDVQKADFTKEELAFVHFPDRTPLEKDKLMGEICPRISCRDAMKMVHNSRTVLTNDSTLSDVDMVSLSRIASYVPSVLSHQESCKRSVVIVDVRPKVEYDAGFLKQSINLPLNEFRSSTPSAFGGKVSKHKGSMIIVCGNTPEEASEVGGKLVLSGYRYVCVLDYPVPVLAEHGILISTSNA